jgi:hypothetical protein
MIDTEILPDNLEVISVDVGDWSRINEILEEQYSNGIRNYVGMAGSGLVISMKDFILRHPDANFICNGSTVTTLPFDAPNFYRMVKVDKENLKATKKLYNITNPQILAESGTQWAESNVNDSKDIWNTQDYLFYDPNNINWSELDNFIDPKKDLWIFSTLNPQILVEIINRYHNNRIFLGDGIYPYQLGIHNRNIFLPLYYGYSSSLLTIYGHPFVVCLYDALIAFSKSYEHKEHISKINDIGYNGPIKFDKSRNRVFGRTVIMRYDGNSWREDGIYGYDNLGEYMSLLKPYKKEESADQKIYPVINSNKVAVIISKEINDKIKEDILNILKNEKLPKSLNIQIHEISQDQLYSSLMKLYNSGCRIYLGFIIYALDNDSLRFFREHPDVLNINCGSTIKNNPLRPGNIYRYSTTDNYIIDSFKKEKIDDLVVLYEKTSPWAISLANEIGGNINKVDFYNVNFDEFDRIIGNSKYIFLLTPINDPLKSIIERYSKSVFYLGKFNNDYDLGISGREIYCYLSLNFSSNLLEKYDYIAINCYDSIWAVDTSIKQNIPLGKLHLVGWSGDLSLDNQGDRKYGRVVVKSYDGKWKYHKVYGYEDIGEYYSIIS